MVALVATLINLALGIVLWANYDIGGAQWQFTERADLFAGFDYALGIDGIALMLIMLQRVPDADLHRRKLGSRSPSGSANTWRPSCSWKC